jgi:hypothetical protein
MKPCPLCENQRIELSDFAHIKLFGLSTTDILFLKEFYINNTGDMTLEKLRERTNEKGFQG